MPKGRPRLFSDLERIERKRSRNRKENMSLEQIEKHNRRGRKENLTLNQLQKKNNRSLKENLTTEELEKKRESRRRYAKTTNGRLKAKNWIKNKRVNNPTFRIMSHISRLISFMLKSTGGSKLGNSIRDFVGWNNFELKNHIEKQFASWMNWNNYGKYNHKIWKDDDIATWTWQLDHIIPRSDLPYTNMDDENFKKCWSLNNLRPLSAKQNILDGTSRVRHLNKRK